jgi:ATP-dependent Clp protease, protease subunit
VEVPRPTRPTDFGKPEDWLTADVLARMLDRRHVFLRGLLDDEAATRLAAELMTLEADAPLPVTMHIHSRGGALSALFTVTDTIAAMGAPVDTVCLGEAVGSAAALLAAGTGTRRAGQNARITLRLPESDVAGTADDIEREARTQSALRDQLYDLLVRVTGRSRDWLARGWDRERSLSAVEACAEGLVDELMPIGRREPGRA